MAKPLAAFRFGRTGLIAMGVIGALILSACGSQGSSKPTKATSSAAASASDGPKADLNAIITAAKAEGSLTIYSGDAQDTLNIEAAEFKAKYGITVNIVRALTDPLDARISTEYSTGVYTADVYQAGSTEQYLQANPSYFTPLTAANLPGYSDYPAIGRKNPLYVYVRENPTVIQYNTNLVPKDKIPTTWKDLLDPFWKGHLELTDLKSSGSYMEWAQVMVNQFGLDYLSQLKAQNLKIAASGTVAAQDVAAGSVYADFPGRIVHSVTLRQNKAPIAYTIMPGSGVPIFLGAFSKAPHPNAAMLFISYLMSVEGQTDYCGKVEGTLAFYNIDGKTPSAQIPGCLPPEDGWSLQPFNVTNDQQNAILKAIGQ